MEKLDLGALVPDDSVLQHLQEQKVEQEESYDEYHVIFNVQTVNDVRPMKLNVYMTKEEAAESSRYLNNIIVNMVKLNTPVSVSITVRNEEHKIVNYGLLGVVGIIHDIPEYNIIE